MTKKVLSVDDSPSVRQMIKLTLSAAGYEVIEAGDGAEGLAKARATPVQRVITDLNMPNMNGLAFIGELRKLPAYRGVPMILLTTESAPEMKAAGKNAGATGWITKPFNQDQLTGVVKKVLGA